MQTSSARRSRPENVIGSFDTVLTRRDLGGSGWTAAAIEAQLNARCWRQLGRAVVLHNGEITASERLHVVLANAGPRSVLTSYTAAAVHGLRGWEREAVHVLVPAGTRVARVHDVPTRVHWVGDWDRVDVLSGRRPHALAPSLVLAASCDRSPRIGAALLAAGGQQRLTTAASLAAALEASPRLRNRHSLALCLHDIGQGAHALSEIDFVALCRRAGLPGPTLQEVRVEPSGRRRYLDAHWRLSDGRRVSVEVDGAIHLAPRRWFADQLRQNELVIAGEAVLRFPSVVVRTEEALVADQLRRMLGVA